MTKRFIAVKNHRGIRKDTKTGNYQARKYIDGKEYCEVFTKISDALKWRNCFHPELVKSQTIETRSLQLSGKQRPNGVEDHFMVEDIWKLYQEQHFSSITPQSRIDIAQRAENIIPDLFGYRMVEINATLLDEIMKKKVSDIKYVNQTRRHTFDKELKTLRAILNWYRENYDAMFMVPILKHHFIAGFLNRKQKTNAKKMTPEEVKRFFDHLSDPFWKDFALIHFFMVGRAQEPAGLQRESVDLENRVLKVSDVTVWNRQKKFSYLKEVPKNGDERLVYLNDTMIDILKRRISEGRAAPCPYLRESTGERLDFVFQEGGEPLHYRQIQYQYNKALKAAGLWPTFKATHILRQAMANIVRQNMGLKAAQAVGGWKSREVVE